MSRSLILAAYACLSVAWAFTIPPFSSPDEWAHYLRALTIAHGQILGAPLESFKDPSLDPKQEAWVAKTVRWADVPPGMAPDGYGCNAFWASVSAACNNRVAPAPKESVRRHIVNGTYEPAPYLLPALFLRAARDPVSGLLLGRVANVIACLSLLAAAAWALRSPPIGLVAAVTPMVIFLASSLNPSGAEIAGAIAFASGLLALVGGSAGRAPWFAAATGGSALCLSRSLGPIWLAIIVIVCFAYGGLRQSSRMLRAEPRASAWTAIVIGVAGMINRAWETAYGPHFDAPRNEAVWAALQASVRELPRWIWEQIGVYQYLDTAMPEAAYWLWSASVIALVLSAAWVGTRRQRIALVLAIAAAVAIPVFLHAFAMRPIGWSIQGRHVLPLTVLVPLLSAEILLRNGRSLARLAPALAAVCGLVQFIGFYSNSRRSAVGVEGSWLFPAAPEWTPPLGWWPWLLIAVVGALLLATTPKVRLHLRSADSINPASTHG